MFIDIHCPNIWANLDKMQKCFHKKKEHLKYVPGPFHQEQ